MMQNSSKSSLCCPMPRLRCCLADFTAASQSPPKWGALSGLNYHVILCESRLHVPTMQRKTPQSQLLYCIGIFYMQQQKERINTNKHIRIKNLRTRKFPCGHSHIFLSVKRASRNKNKPRSSIANNSSTARSNATSRGLRVLGQESCAFEHAVSQVYKGGGPPRSSRLSPFDSW